MQHNYKGFDIKSFNRAGKAERYIEVKSTSIEWGAYGVRLSVAQFEKSVQEGGRYWLYVVERADQPDAKIYCIQNPAARITNYCFDKGWKDLDKNNPFRRKRHRVGTPTIPSDRNYIGF
jgi:hypothetical protein